MRYATVTELLANMGSARWEIHYKTKKLIEAGADIVSLTIGQPDIQPDPRVIQATVDALHSGRTTYSNGRGEDSIINPLIARYASRFPGVARENFIIVPGAQTALFLVMYGLTETGNHVLTGDPFYACYDGSIGAGGATRVSVPLRASNGFRMQAKDLEAAITPNCRALLLNTPHNPTGAVLSRTDIEAIGEVCEEHDLWIVSDEVYETLIYPGGPEFVSPLDIPRLRERTIVVSSVSKSHAMPGYRCGWVLAETGICDRLLPLAENMLFGNQPFVSDAAGFALANVPETAEELRRSYGGRVARICETLDGKHGLKIHRPEAGMFVLMDVTDTGLGDEEFAARLLDHGVGVMPGVSFGDRAAGLVRMSVTVPDERLETAISRILAFAKGLGA